MLTNMKVKVKGWGMGKSDEERIKSVKSYNSAMAKLSPSPTCVVNHNIVLFSLEAKINHGQLCMRSQWITLAIVTLNA